MCYQWSTQHWNDTVASLVFLSMDVICPFWCCLHDGGVFAVVGVMPCPSWSCFFCSLVENVPGYSSVLSDRIRSGCVVHIAWIVGTETLQNEDVSQCVPPIGCQWVWIIRRHEQTKWLCSYDGVSLLRVCPYIGRNSSFFCVQDLEDSACTGPTCNSSWLTAQNAKSVRKSHCATCRATAVR